MRELKFAGKVADEPDEWVIGYLIGKNAIFQTKKHKNTKCCEVGTFIVKEETIRQFIGLKDKNGAEIYEGDIVTGTDYPFIDEGKQNYIGIVEYYEDLAQYGYTYQCVRKDKRGISNGINNEFEANEDLICEDLEIIGNIFDNPELVEGKNEN